MVRVVTLAVAGAKMVGPLESSGLGTQMIQEDEKTLAKLRRECEERNAVLAASLKEDPHAGKLLEMARADAKLGRASEPVPFSEFDTRNCLLHPRFMVEQAKADGSTKYRPIDHFSWSDGGGREDSVNGHVFPRERLKHDTLDQLEAVMRLFVECTGQIPGLVKEDVDSAFRRIPIAADQRWVCGCAFAAEQTARSFMS